MSRDRIPAWRRPTSVLLVTSAVLVTLAWNGTADPVAAATRRRPRRQGEGCPLTLPQQVNSITAFKKMIPVFRSPRCANCHGGIADPLGSNTATNHMGVVEIKAADGPKTCEECHMDKWHVAPLSPWTDQSNLQLCAFMKEGNTGAEFIDHIVRDQGGPQFIEAAFKGMRGLTEGGQSIVEDDLGKIAPAPPPGTHSQMVQYAKDWVKAQGGQFVGDNDCGCSLDKVHVEFISKMTVTAKGVTKASSRVTAMGDKWLFLGPDQSEPDFIATTGPDGENGRVSWSNVEINRGNGCVVTVQGSPASDVKLWLGVGGGTEPRLRFQFVPSADIHSVLTKCPHPVTGRMYTGMAGEKEAGVFLASWIALHSSNKVATSPASMPNLAAADPAKMKALAEKMQNSPGNPADAAQLQAMMKQILPNSDAMLAEARENFMFTMPGPWCKPEEPYLAVCTIKRTTTVPDNLGSTMTITEDTWIRFSH